MRKDEIQKLRENILRNIETGIEKKRLPVPIPDARLYPQEVDNELFWIDRLTYPGVWPHTGHGATSAPVPGLRYEVWYFQKRETALLALLGEDRLPLRPLVAALEPVFSSFISEGKYARRYRSVNERSPEAELIRRLGPDSRGIWRTAPASLEKLAKALETMIIDTYATVLKAIKSVDPDGHLPQEYGASVEERDPLAELQARFNAGKSR